MAVIKLERGIPLPRRSTGSGSTRRRYPFAEMKVNESFRVAADDPVTMQRRVAAACSHASKRGLGKFTTRLEKGGVRVWKLS